MNNYNIQISIAKGFGIILMVIGHVYLTGAVNTWIYAFHMPLFFFISGFCLNEKYFINTKEFIRNKLSSLYLTFIKYNIIFILLHNLLYTLQIVENKYNYIDIGKQVFKTIIFMDGTEQLLGGFWFLKQLLFASIFGIFLIKYTKNFFSQLLLLFTLIFLFNFYNINIQYLTIGSQTILAILFYVIGYKIKKTKIHYNFVLILLSAIVVLYISHYIPNHIHGTTIYNFIPFIISSLAGIYMTLGISEHICKYWKNKTLKFITHIIEYIGKNTITILIWHFLTFRIITYIAITYYNLPKTDLTSHPIIISKLPNENIWFIIYCISGIFLPILLKQTILLFYNKIHNHATQGKCNSSNI